MMTTQRVVTLLLEGDIYAAPAMNPECEAPSCDDDVPVKLKMSVTLSCAGLAGAGAADRTDCGKTRLQVAAAGGGAQGAHPPARSHSCLGGAQEAGAQEVVTITCNNPAQCYHGPTTQHQNIVTSDQRPHTTSVSSIVNQVTHVDI